MTEKRPINVLITDKKDQCYGMVGEVFSTDNMEDGRIRYHVNIKGYDNCIKAGYSPQFIRQRDLDKQGFSRIIDDTHVKVLTPEEEKSINYRDLLQEEPDKETDKDDYISRKQVIDLIEPRLNSAKEGSLEYQRLYSILASVKELDGYEPDKYTDKAYEEEIEDYER